MEKLFEDNTIKEVKLNHSLTSFKDCPNRCVDGFYINPYKHTKTKCEYCSEKRKELIKDKISLEGDKSIGDLLHLPNTFIGYGNFEIDSIIPSFEKKVMNEESVGNVTDFLGKMINDISIGVVPEYSLLINLGKRAHKENFISPYLYRAYNEGLSISPYIQASVLYDLRFNENKEVAKEMGYEDVTFASFLNTDVCIVDIDAGSNRDIIANVRGLVQLRAKNGKSTIVFMDVNPSFVKSLNSMEEKRLDYCYYISIIYDAKVEQKDEYYSERGVAKNSTPNMTKSAFGALSSYKNRI